jgi:hypothetical protein
VYLDLPFLSLYTGIMKTFALTLLALAVTAVSWMAFSNPEPVAPKNTYAQDKALVEALRARHAEVLANGNTSITKTALKDLSAGITDRLIPHWYGTRWDFNGVTRTPGEGEIACGYFITTLALDAGLQVERAKLAQQASSNIIQTLCTESSIKRHWKGFDAFLAHMRQSPNGLYIVGLDFHCGFFLKDDTGMYFIHSNYIGRKGVMKEKAEDSQALSDSKSFMSGCLSSNEELAKKWLKGEKIPTVVH